MNQEARRDQRLFEDERWRLGAVGGDSSVFDCRGKDGERRGGSRRALHVTSPMRVIFSRRCSKRPTRPISSSSSPSSAMSSLRHHRVIIASLFLPSTAVLGESPPASPGEPSVTHLGPPPAFGAQVPHSRANPLARTSGPLKSIVEDLRDKVSDRPLHSLERGWFWGRLEVQHARIGSARLFKSDVATAF